VSRGAHAADDGSFARSAGTAAVRGALLIILAVALGIALLATTGDDDIEGVATDDSAEVDTPPASTPDVGTPTTTTAPPAPQARPPAEVRVLVANGSGVAGVATRFKDQLAGAGYNALAPVNTTSRPLPSVVYFAPGFDAEADALAATLAPAPPVEAIPAEPPVEQLGEADVLVVVGPELASS
jgi:hypothetical protein